MHHLHKVIYAFGLTTLLYLAEEVGRKKGRREERAVIREIIKEFAFEEGYSDLAFEKIKEEVSWFRFQ